MNADSIKGRHFELLKTINNLCLDRHIDMFLCGDTALSAYRDGELSDYVTVAISASDAPKLISAIDDSDIPYETESMLNNGGYPSFEFRVFDRSTTDFEINKCRKYLNNCLHVTVKLVEHVSAMKLSWTMARARFKSYKKGIRLPAEVNSTDVSAPLFDRMVKAASASSGKIWFNSKEFPKTMLGSFDQVELYGEKFNIPARTEAYLALEFGAFWRAYEPAAFDGRDCNFRSVSISWDDYQTAISSVDLAGYDKVYSEFRSIDKGFRKYQSVVNTYYQNMERTFDRFYLYENLECRKDEFMKLHDNGDFTVLRKELDEYIMLMEHHARAGLGLCFDPDILDIALDVLKHEGRSKDADELKALVPEQHMKPITIRDYTEAITEAIEE